MIQVDINSLLPKFLLADKNGYAMGMVIERAAMILFKAAQDGLETVLNVEKMLEWRLDELAWEYNISWYDHGASIGTKREIIKNVYTVSRNLGTKSAVENVIRTYFGDGDVEEWFDYDGLPGHFRVQTINPTLREEKLEQFLFVLENVKRLSAKLDEVVILLDGQFDLFAGFALHEAGYELYDLRE